MAAPSPLLIDGLQFCRWSRDVFEQMRAAGMSAVHVTIAYHENFRRTVDHVVAWNARFRDHADLILHARSVEDIDRARASGRTAILFGLQNPMPVEDDFGLVEVLHTLGIRFLQPTYNNQSLLGSGWMEPVDGGLTRMGREVIGEMNRLGMVVDLSHAGERTALEAIACSSRPVAVSHANPAWWRATGRNVSRPLMEALAARGGMLGLSLYPHHLPDSSQTTLARFCAMARDTAEVVGIDRVGIGSDLCQDQPDEVVRWMREGKWCRPGDAPINFPAQPDWFRDNRDFPRIAEGLTAAGFRPDEVEKLLGGNWYRFLRDALRPLPATSDTEAAA
ncbi:dipeptidase [Ancylobacter sp. 6x-1]|uniref:Dipeptidase n=1 Tax=Ancylobacter crimeensis TaxID=2579147 RepID=A0ABT0D8H0_9HYPH|nr:membrane dipeptidase [Ancylobacter crimeensis]MCK0196242.1 dipeptidase [Ancylobacter crimeensis]